MFSIITEDFEITGKSIGEIISYLRGLGWTLNPDDIVTVYSSVSKNSYAVRADDLVFAFAGGICDSY